MPNPIPRHSMPMIAYRTLRDPLYGGHGVSGRVRIHQPSENWFRKPIEVPQVNPLLGGDGGGPMVFNRGSLVKYLNAELDYFTRYPVNQEPLPQHLQVGWFGGRLGGSSDERIRVAYRRVFECYQPSYDACQEHRSLDLSSFFHSTIAVEPKISDHERWPLACSKTYLEGSAQVSLFRTFCPYLVYRPSCCSIHICLRDRNIDIPSLMDIIAADETFSGTLKDPICVVWIGVNYSAPEEDMPDNERNLLIGGWVETMRNWQRTRLWDREKGFDKKALEEAVIEKDDVIPPGLSPFDHDSTLRLFLSSDPEHPNTLSGALDRQEGAMASVEMRVLGDTEEWPNEIVHSKDNFFIRIKILDPHLEAENLMNSIAALQVQGLTYLDFLHIDLIMISLDEIAFPNSDDREARKEAFLEGIRQWQRNAQAVRQEEARQKARENKPTARQLEAFRRFELEELRARRFSTSELMSAMSILSAILD